MEHCVPTLTTDICGMHDIKLYDMACELRLDSFNYVSEMREKYYNSLYNNN